MSKYTEFRTESNRIGLIVEGRMQGEQLETKNVPDRLSVITRDFSERIENINEWRKVIRNNPIEFVKLYSVWTPPQPKQTLTPEQNRERIKRLKEISFKCNQEVKRN